MSRWGWSPWRWVLWHLGYLGLWLARYRIESVFRNSLKQAQMRRKRAMLRNWLKFMIHLAQRNPANPRKEDYNYHWGFTSFEGKTVLDFGADYGSTACWFLSKGAKHVVAVEGHPAWAFGLRYLYGRDRRVVCVQQWIGSGDDIEKLLRLFHPDVVKIDIEGHEGYLLSVTDNALATVKEWLIETHGDLLARQISERLESVGFCCERKIHVAGHMGYPSCNIFYCKWT